MYGHSVPASHLREVLTKNEPLYGEGDELPAR